MKDYQRDFIELSLARGALSFGNFTLKSGRQSPYFFNAVVFNTGQDLQKLGQFYAIAIENSKLQYDALFGPAYKGIPLVAATVIGLTAWQKNIPYAFNRKEVKDHGEGGRLVGADISHKKVLIIDDVITAGTAIRETVNFLNAIHAIFAGVIIALDRQERGQSCSSAIQEIEEKHNVPVISIITMTNLIEYLEIKGLATELSNMKAYRDEYGML